MDATSHQIESICGIADEAMQQTLQSRFDVTDAEAELIIKNEEKLMELLRAASEAAIAEIIGRKPEQ